MGSVRNNCDIDYIRNRFISLHNYAVIRNHLYVRGNKSKLVPSISQPVESTRSCTECRLPPTNGDDQNKDRTSILRVANKMN